MTISLYSRQVRGLLAEHADDREWSAEEVAQAVTDHALYTWGATDAMNKAALHMVRADGVYFHTADGKKYLDFNSQVCAAAYIPYGTHLPTGSCWVLQRRRHKIGQICN